MLVNPYYTRLWKLERYRVGPLRPYLDGFSMCLEEKGYAQSTGQRYVREVGRLSQWMAKRGVEFAHLREEVVIRYSRARKRGRRCPVQMAPYQLFLQYLRGEGHLSFVEEQATQGIAPWAEPYRRHLVERQGLAAETVRKYMQVAHEFLLHCFGKEQIDVSQLEPSDVTFYLIDRCTLHSSGRAGWKVSALRSFLRYLYFLGQIPSDLAQHVPSVPHWRQADLPSYLEPGDIDLLLGQCKEETPIGLRDRAILLLLVRLGLRAVEVCRLQVDDVDWHASEILIRGKGGKQSHLPLTKDIGEAIVSYVQRGRPRTQNRSLFLRTLAPHRELTSSSIAHAVRRALGRAGLTPARKGSHLLRHTCATQMRRQGASLTDIGQILRHQRPDTTAVYAKVDVGQLRSVARPWPKEGVS